ncbi:MAG: hypothetical protein UZ17_ACD001001497 [Acidobacteria bacterium OLB17]|nr:MAG: hypothetical protein UZ17_ACD001001497 [Acidobacteria bacterium OLB17]
MKNAARKFLLDLESTENLRNSKDPVSKLCDAKIGGGVR